MEVALMFALRKTCVVLAAAGMMGYGLSVTGLVAEGRPAVGDRIEFSGLELPGSLMGSDEDRIRWGSRFESLQRGGSMGGVVETSPALPSGSMLRLPNDRMLDLMEQRRDWIFVTEPYTGHQMTAEEALGVRNYDLRAADGQRRSGLVNFMKGDRSREETQQTRNPLFDSSRDELLFDSYLEQPLLGDGWRDLQFGQSQSQSAREQAGGIESFGLGVLVPASELPQTSGSLYERDTSRANRDVPLVPGSTQNLWPPSDRFNPFTATFDPIHFRTDTTRQEMNPTTALQPRLDISSSRRSLDYLEDVARAGTTSGLDLMERVMPEGQPSASSLAPVVRSPSEAQRTQPAIRFGEFPSRRF